MGQDGVKALRDFGAQTTELSNELAKAFTLIAAAAAKIISQSSGFKEIQTQLPRAVAFQQAKKSDNPEIQRLFRELEGTNAFLPGGSAKRAELGDKIIEKQLEINRLREEGNSLAAEGITIVANEKELATESAELVNLRKLALAAEGDQRLTLLAQVDEQVAKEALLAEKAELLKRAKLGEISYRRVALELQEKQVKSDERLRQIREGLAKDLAGGGSSGVDKEAQVEKTLAGLKTKEFELDTKILNIGLNKLDQTQTQLDRLNALRVLKEAEINISTEDARIKQQKLVNLEKETSILRQQLELQRERIKLEQEIDAIRARQTADNLQTSLNQELAGITLPSGNSFLDEQNALKAEQENRYANALQAVNDQLEIQRKLATSTDQAISDAAELRIEQLERTRGIYETMLPQIAAAEQAQLKFNQTLSLVQGPVNAFVNSLTAGLKGVIDGTKSAEEAFADMVENLADKFLDMAAKILRDAITQQLMNLFTNLLGAFGGGGGGSFGVTPLTSGMNFFRAEGGAISANEPYIVGERGPELVIPNSSGTVLSNQDSRAALSTFARMSPEDQKAADKGEDPMAAAAAVALQPIQMDTRVINSEEYATVEQVQVATRQAAAEGAKQGAKMGEAQMLRRMRMNPATRKQIGI